MIRYLKNTEIDFTKWDDCVQNSPAGLIYSHTFFLQNLCNWDGLVLNDYEAVMPLPKRKKIGINYIYNPAYAAQTGITGINVNAAVIQQFLTAIPLHFRFIQLNFNEFNIIETTKLAAIKERINYTLNLNKPYTLLAQNFTKDARKNIRQAQKNNLTAVKNIETETVFTFYKNMYGQYLKGGALKDFDQFINVCKAAIKLNKGFTLGIKDTSGELLSASFWGIDGKRVYYLLGAPTDKGKKLGATYFLINHLVELYAGSNLLLDFEGSDISSVASFYRQFSPDEKKYPLITINRLPFYLRWLK